MDQTIQDKAIPLTLHMHFEGDCSYGRSEDQISFTEQGRHLPWTIGQRARLHPRHGPLRHPGAVARRRCGPWRVWCGPSAGPINVRECRSGSGTRTKHFDWRREAVCVSQLERKTHPGLGARARTMESTGSTKARHRDPSKRHHCGVHATPMTLCYSRLTTPIS